MFYSIRDHKHQFTSIVQPPFSDHIRRVEFCIYRGCYNISHSKMVGCAVIVDTSFAQCWNREYRTVNKTMLFNSACIIPSHTNVNNAR